MAGVELLPREYGYVVLVLVFYCFINFWMTAQVGRARKKYNVSYPTLYASEADNKDAKLFNCIQALFLVCLYVQRGHQNSVEMLPMFLMLMILGGIRHPVIAASLGVVYCISRIFYFKGYSTGDPQKRLSIGRYGFLALFGLIICTISCGAGMLTA